MTIIEELRQNRESGARRLEAEYKAGLMALARRFCADESDAEELVNSTFATVVENIDDYLEQSAFFAWMCQILTRTHAMSVRRKANRMIDYTGDVPDILDETGPEAIYGNLDASLMREAIGLLPDDQREIIVLRYFMDMPIAKIAKFLAIPSGTVRSRLHYARAALAAKLGAAAKKPGVKALLVMLALGAITALGAAIAGARAARPLDPKADEPSALRQNAEGGGITGSPDTPDINIGNTGTIGNLALCTNGTEETSPLDAFSVSPVPPALSFIKSLSPIPSTQTKTTMNTTQLLAGPLAALALAAPTAGFTDTPSTNTIAYWPFGENGFSDVSGNGHDLASTTVTESDAGYITLNGTSQFLTTASALDLSGETAVTFECWTRSTGKNSSFGVLFSAPSPAGTSAGSFVLYYTGRLQSQFGMGTGWQIDYTASTSAMDDGTWHHVAYVIDRTQTGENATKLYLDGVQMQNAGGQTGAVPALLDDVLYIGGGSAYSSGNNFYTGYIDDVRISRGALTPDQFLKYPSVGKAMRADSNALPVVAYWPFGGKGGKDATGNGFDLAMGVVPMVAGTPSIAFSERHSWSGDFKCTNMPFSVFSKIGMTIEFFAKTGSGATDAGNILTLSPNQNYYNNAGAFRIGPNGSEGGHKSMQVAFRRKDSGKYAQSTTTLSSFGELNDSKWRHFAVVYNPSDSEAVVKMYVDGVLATTADDEPTQGAITLLDTTLYFQRVNYSSAASGFVGSFDDVRITAGALTPDQFLSSRSAGSTVALYRFDRETIEDQSGNGNDLIHMHTESTVADPVFGDAGFPDSGTGLVLSGTEDKSGNIGTRDWVKTASPIDFSESKAFTVEFDYNSNDPSETVIPSGKTDKPVYVLAASTQVATRGGFVVYRPGASLQGQFRTNTGSGWLKYYAQNFGDMKDGYRRGRYSVNGKNTGYVYFNLVVDGTANSQSSAVDYGSFGSHVIGFGHCPSYYADATTPYYMKGKLLRAAISDIALDPADYVLDNLVLDTPKSTLAYWNFAGDAGLTTTGAPRRNGALDLDGSSPVTTTNLTLSALTQATIECFVCFGTTPSSGTLFGLGTGVGSFAVAADATAGTLSGSFIPYDHLAASNGGATALAPLAGKKVWHHVALVIDRTNPGADAVRFYVDYERTTPAGRAWDAAATMLDGAISIGNGFTGWIDDLRVSAGALAPTEFLQPDMRTETPDAFTIVIR